METDEFLSHYGIKGMRWGVINEDDPIGLTEKGKKEKSKIRKKS